MTSGLTRDQVIAAADGLRAPEPSAAAEAATDTAVRSIIDRTVSAGPGEIVDYTAYPGSPGHQVDGLLVDVSIYEVATGTSRSATFVALGTADPDGTLSGTVTVAGTSRPDGTITDTPERLVSADISGDVFVTEPVATAGSGTLLVSVAVDAAPTGEVPAPTTIDQPVTAAEKAAARKVYDQRLKDAKKKYTKARKKAGSSRRKKAKAKRDHSRRKTAAKAAYVRAIAPRRITQGSPPAARLPDLTISTETGWAVAV